MYAGSAAPVSCQAWPNAPRHNQNYDGRDTWKQDTAEQMTTALW